MDVQCLVAETCTQKHKAYVLYPLHTVENVIFHLRAQPAATYDFNIGAHFFPRASTANWEAVGNVVIDLKGKIIKGI